VPHEHDREMIREHPVQSAGAKLRNAGGEEDHGRHHPDRAYRPRVFAARRSRRRAAPRPQPRVQRPRIARASDGEDAEDEDHQGVEVLDMTEVVRQPEQIYRAAEGHRQRSAREKSRSREGERELEQSLQYGDGSLGQQRQGQEPEQRYRHPELGRDRAPFAEVLRQVVHQRQRAEHQAGKREIGG